MSEATSATGRTISAMFDSESDAKSAADELIATGISTDAVTLTPGHRKNQPATDHAGFMDAIANFFFTDEQRAVYAEGLKRGGFLVTVQLKDQSRHDDALRILAKKGGIDIDERAEQWRAAGWRG